MAKMKLLFGCLLLILAVFVPHTSYAYTDEEKAQAKAWLSAHGYSPDSAGAAQAYQDYLDGKFDEELGITTGDGDEALEVTEATTELTTEETTAHPKRELPAKREKRARVEESTEGRTGQVLQGAEEEMPDDESAPDEESESGQAAGGGRDTVEEPVSYTGEGKIRLRRIVDGSGETVITIAEGRLDRRNEKAIFVTAAGTLWMLLLNGIISILRKRRKKPLSAVEEAMLAQEVAAEKKD